MQKIEQIFHLIKNDNIFFLPCVTISIWLYSYWPFSKFYYIVKNEILFLIQIFLTAYLMSRFLKWINLVDILLRTPILCDMIFYLSSKDREIIKFLSTRNTKFIAHFSHYKSRIIYKDYYFYNMINDDNVLQCEIEDNDNFPNLKWNYKAFEKIMIEHKIWHVENNRITICYSASRFFNLYRNKALWVLTIIPLILLIIAMYTCFILYFNFFLYVY